jgi:two-component system KDP operon response regulator KdpE
MASSSKNGRNRLAVAQLSEPTRILVIDDDHEMTELMRIILDPQSFEVYTTNSGLNGLDLVGQIDPEVVVIDLMMPDIDGFALCKSIREFSQVPILVLSAVNKPGIAAQALEMGADDYLNKPMKSNLLIAHLNKLARRSRSIQGELVNEDPDRK